MTNITDYLKPETPDSVREYLAILEGRNRRTQIQKHQKLVESESQKPATWLVHLDGFKESPFAERESPDYWGGIGYHLANAAWDVRLMIAPDIPLETAQELAQGLADWIKRMTPEEYDDFRGHPAHGPQIEPPANPCPYPDYDDVPF